MLSEKKRAGWRWGGTKGHGNIVSREQHVCRYKCAAVIQRAISREEKAAFAFVSKNDSPDQCVGWGMRGRRRKRKRKRETQTEGYRPS